MKHYLVVDVHSNELFIVGEYDLEAAINEARKYFDDPQFIEELTEEEAENSGLDEF